MSLKKMFYNGQLTVSKQSDRYRRSVENGLCHAVGQLQENNVIETSGPVIDTRANCENLLQREKRNVLKIFT